MRRCRRLPLPLLNAATAMSLVLCVATVALWVRSYSYVDTVMRAKAGKGLWVAVCRQGECELIRAGPWFYDEPPRHFAVRGASAPSVMIGNAGARYWGWGRFHVWGGGGNWATRPDTGRPYRAAEELDGDFWFDDPRTGTVSLLSFHHLYFPIWSLAGVLALPPVGWCFGRVARWWRRRARRAGRCPECGYDLRATPDHCPECGAVPPQTSSAA